MHFVISSPCVFFTHYELLGLLRVARGDTTMEMSVALSTIYWTTKAQRSLEDWPALFQFQQGSKVMSSGQSDVSRETQTPEDMAGDIIFPRISI